MKKKYQEMKNCLISVSNVRSGRSVEGGEKRTLETLSM